MSLTAVDRPTTTTAKAVPVTTPTTKMSPLLRDMLDDVEVDNDASILRKMEQIVNQYKARVENLLAKEGKTLHDEDWTENKTLGAAPTAVDTQHTTAVSSRTVAATATATTTSTPPPVSPLPSRIPLFQPKFSVYRPKETCL
jgi:hypothetical protein